MVYDRSAIHSSAVRESFALTNLTARTDTSVAPRRPTTIVLPLEFLPGDSAASLGLDGHETFDIRGLGELVEDFAPGRKLKVTAKGEDGGQKEFEVKVRLDTPQEMQYYRHGGILQYVLRQLL